MNIFSSKEKLNIITTSKHVTNCSSININVDNQQFLAPCSNYKDIFTFLGAFFNIVNDSNLIYKHIIKKLKRTLSSFRYKRITIDHYTYIVNKVIIPRLLYQSQLIIFSDLQYNNINSLINARFKSIMGLAKSTTSHLLYNNFGPRLMDFKCEHLAQQAELTHLSLNLKIFFSINQIEYSNLMNLLWIPYIDKRFIFQSSSYIRKYSFLLSSLFHLFSKNINIINNIPFIQREGIYPIWDYLPHNSINLKKLSNHCDLIKFYF